MRITMFKEYVMGYTHKWIILELCQTQWIYTGEDTTTQTLGHNIIMLQYKKSEQLACG